PIRETGVSRAAAGDEVPGEHAAAAGDEGLSTSCGRLARLEHPERSRSLSPMAYRPARDLSSHLLVRHGHEQEVVRRPLAPLGEKVEGARQGRETALHVDGTGRQEALSLDARVERREYGVEMSEEEQVAARGVAPAGEEHRERSRGATLFVDDLRDEAAGGEGLGEEARGAAKPLAVAARRRGRGEPAEEVESAREDRLGEIAGRHQPL